jgi:hypothetical protein
MLTKQRTEKLSQDNLATQTRFKGSSNKDQYSYAKLLGDSLGIAGLKTWSNLMCDYAVIRITAYFIATPKQ